MSYQVNNNYNVKSSGQKTYVSQPSKDELMTLAQMYKEQLKRTEAEQNMWEEIQRETSKAISAQFKNGEISEKVAKIRELMNDAAARKVYARCAAQADMANFQWDALKRQYPQYFEKRWD